MNKFTKIEDSALDQVTGGGIISDLLDETIYAADETLEGAIDLGESVFEDTLHFLTDTFDRFFGIFFDFN